MARPRKQDRSSVATDTLTVRLSPDDRAMRDRLVAHRAAELAEEGIEVTAASFVRGLIRREAKARGLLDATSGNTMQGNLNPSMVTMPPSGRKNGSFAGGEPP